MPAFQKKAVLLIGLVLIFLGGSFYLHIKDELNAAQAPPKPETLSSQSTKADPVCTVYISGAVVKPGLYQVDPKSRVHEALALAGGITDQADLNRVNLAKNVKDGMQINVPEKKITHSGSKTASTEAAVVQGQTKNSLKSTAALMNLNQATAQDLDGLPGIGQTLAQRILDYRTQHGPFTAIEQLKQVSGLSEAKIEKIRPYLIVE